MPLAAADHETPVVELDQQSALRQDANAKATANANAHLLSKLQAAAAQDSNARRLLANLLTRAQAVTSSSAAAASSSSFSSQTSFGDLRTSQFLASLEEPDLQAQLPAFVKPLPARIASEDVKYLHTKGALSLPPLPLQTALLQAYVEYVHPYMPLLDLREFLGAVNARDGLCGQVSLFLYQAIMFAATAFVDMKALKEAGYSTRKAARRSFFSKTRLLYDFDYESDRLVLVQALLLMTYWYETPDDQKDTWHWMGVAISLAHTIGLHRNPATTSMPLRKQKLWKRIWWSCFMRDRLVALGMRRPTRIKDEDYDVPMLTENDFEIELLAEENHAVPAECTLVRDIAMQQELASMCVAKAKLCICISHMLKAQYSVLIRDKMRPDNTVNSTMMLFPNKKLDNFESVTSVDLELMAWAEASRKATNNTNVVLPQTINAAALDLSASPPSTDKDLESSLGGLTPSASEGSEEPELLDLDFLQGQDDIDWTPWRAGARHGPVAAVPA
ncbi:cutinase transcription factor 1 beta [Verticillium alfalfae VaMs.102]|uniref:Cutinase transcription factor 1 beta n=1 Tax=Verticillium alfalfae (strain VaMs.102 / ATCC MYA-4576 / FGSC 10136) TaxID=526221 RepID=C9SFN9_VERA1|nr:cutinase transcription factor 1 beta [Verticillium alfalfae VaMs.102]EEY17984.1 cutinase transcription factor 1 beta [Verticillium alfalfae VaMs.102]